MKYYLVELLCIHLVLLLLFFVCSFYISIEICSVYHHASFLNSSIFFPILSNTAVLADHFQSLLLGELRSSNCLPSFCVILYVGIIFLGLSLLMNLWSYQSWFGILRQDFCPIFCFLYSIFFYVYLFVSFQLKRCNYQATC